MLRTPGQSFTSIDKVCDRSPLDCSITFSTLQCVVHLKRQNKNYNTATKAILDTDHIQFK